MSIGGYMLAWLFYIAGCCMAMRLMWGVLRYVRPQLAQEALKLACAAILLAPCQLGATYLWKAPALMVLFYHALGVKSEDPDVAAATLAGGIFSLCVSLGCAMVTALLINQLRAWWQVKE